MAVCLQSNDSIHGVQKANFTLHDFSFRPTHLDAPQNVPSRFSHTKFKLMSLRVSVLRLLQNTRNLLTEHEDHLEAVSVLTFRYATACNVVRGACSRAMTQTARTTSTQGCFHSHSRNSLHITDPTTYAHCPQPPVTCLCLQTHHPIAFHLCPL